MSTLRFVLVHGGWHDGAAWDAVAGHLRSRGHEVHAPTIAGHGKGANKNVTHDEYRASIVDYIVGQDLRSVVLVGHSLGGSVISRAAPQVAERLRRLVFWNAIVPLDGESVLGDTPQAQMLAQLAQASADNSIVPPFPFWREVFMNDADITTARRVYEEYLSPEPWGPAVEKLDMKPFYAMLASGRVPCSYLNCTEDNVLPWHPQMSSRLGMFRLVQMPGGHESLFTNPALLAAKLVEAGRD